jgi:putative ABC transport system permease protein
MLFRDYARLTVRSVRAHRLRSVLTGLGIAVGIAAVVLLTSIGEGIHRYVLEEFTQFGTTVVTIAPGRTKTHGANVGVFGTTRPLTLADVQALQRLPGVAAVMGLVSGNAEVKTGGRTRRVQVLGVGPRMPEIYRSTVAYGRFLPPDDIERPRALAVLGAKTARELFGDRSALGARVQVAGDRFRVVGVMETKGQFLGFDLDDAVYVPTAWTLSMFDREGVMEIDVLYAPDTDPDAVVKAVERTLRARHGRLDFTITTQAQMLATLGSVLSVLTFAVGALGSISLFVGAIGILTIMTIAVRERTAEIGLLRALGARGAQVLGLFLGEAVVLSALGGLAGLALGVGLAALLRLFVPALPVHTPWTYAALSLALSAIIGLLAGALPARRAARLDPVEALRAE